VNLIEDCVEVYLLDSQSGSPLYLPKVVYPNAMSVPLRLDGKLIAEIPVANLLPEGELEVE